MYATFFEGVQNKTQKRCALAITLDKEEFIIGVDSILLDQAVSEIFYFKHNVGPPKL